MVAVWAGSWVGVVGQKDQLRVSSVGRAQVQVRNAWAVRWKSARRADVSRRQEETHMSVGSFHKGEKVCRMMLFLNTTRGNRKQRNTQINEWRTCVECAGREMWCLCSAQHRVLTAMCLWEKGFSTVLFHKEAFTSSSVKDTMSVVLITSLW